MIPIFPATTYRSLMADLPTRNSQHPFLVTFLFHIKLAVARQTVQCDRCTLLHMISHRLSCCLKPCIGSATTHCAQTTKQTTHCRQRKVGAGQLEQAKCFNSLLTKAERALEPIAGFYVCNPSRWRAVRIARCKVSVEGS